MPDPLRQRFIGRGPRGQSDAERDIRREARRLQDENRTRIDVRDVLAQAAVLTAMMPATEPQATVDFEDGTPPRTVGLLGVLVALVPHFANDLARQGDAAGPPAQLLLGPHVPETDA